MINPNLHLLARVNVETTYWLLVLFLLINMSVFVTGSANIILFQMPIIIYAIGVLAFKKSVPAFQGSLFANLLPALLYIALIYALILMFPIQEIPMSFAFAYPSALFAILFFLVVGFSETIIWTIGLTQRIGIIWSSALFALFHLTTNIFLSGGTDPLQLFKLSVWQFFANIGFFLIWINTGNILVVSLAHAMIDLAKLGYL